MADELLIKYAQGVGKKDKEQLRETYALELLKSAKKKLGKLNIERVRLTTASSANELQAKIVELERDFRVEYAEPSSGGRNTGHISS